MKIVPGITWASGDTVTHTKLNNFLLNATITSGDQDDVALGDGALDSLTDGTDNVALGDNAGTAVTSGDDNVFIGQDAGLDVADGSYNVAIGKNSLANNDSGYSNVAVGYNAMSLGTDKPANNVCVGLSAGTNIAGDVDTSGQASHNTMVGSAAGTALTTGLKNTFIGASAGSSLTTTSFLNVAVGFSALGNASAAVDGAVAVGTEALQANTADLNTGLGYKAGYTNSSGDDNTYVGSQAGYSNATAADNTFVGDNAGYYVTAAQNTALGSGAHSASGDAALTNVTSLGYAVNPTASNQVRLGNASVSSLHCQVSLTADSDKRIKKNVKTSKIGLDFINALRSVDYKKKNPYNWPDELKEHRFKKENPDKKPADDPKTYNGFIAQEVREAMDKSGITEWDGWSRGANGMESLTATAMIGPLVKAVQELSAKVAKLEAAG